MTRHPANDRGPAQLLRLIAIELANQPPRITRALEVMSDARSPLRANSYEANITTGGGPDPGQTAIAAQAEHDRRTLNRAIRELDMQSRIIRSILNEWAPEQTKGGITIWCQNHLNHGYQVPRASDGSTNCGWCCNVHRPPPKGYGVWPTRALIELHDRGRRISEAEYRRLLGKSAVA